MSAVKQSTFVKVDEERDVGSTADRDQGSLLEMTTSRFCVRLSRGSLIYGGRWMLRAYGEEDYGERGEMRWIGFSYLMDEQVTIIMPTRLLNRSAMLRQPAS